MTRVSAHRSIQHRSIEHRPIETRRRFGGGGVAAFGEMLVVGLVVVALSLPVITFVPAIAAGARHLENHLADERDTVRDLLSLGWQAIRSGWAFGLASMAVIALLLMNVVLSLQGLVPGGAVFAGVSGLLALGVLVVVCRVAALWRPGLRWSELWRHGRMVTANDPVGSALVVVGIGVAATVVWMLPPLIAIAPGLIVVALVAAERRRLPATSEGNS